MAQMTLYTDNFQSTPYVLPCYDLDFMTTFTNPLYSGYTLFSFTNKTFNNPFYSIVYRGLASFSTQGGEGEDIERFDLIEDLPTPFLQPIQWQHASADYSYFQPKDGTYSVITSKPSDWEKICTTSIATRRQDNGRIEFSSNTDWNNLSEFAAQNQRDILKFDYPLSRIFLVTGGQRDFSFGIYNGFDAQVPGERNINLIHSGISYNLPVSNMWNGIAAQGAPTNLSFKDLFDNTPLIGWSTGASIAPPDSDDGTAGVTYANSYPVSFMIPKDTTIDGVTLPKNASFYGVMSVAFNSYGMPVSFIVQALSSEMWSVKSGAGKNFGADSLPSGGKGKQKKGGYDPRKTITKNTSGGLLTNPTDSAGFVIYKFTPSEFTAFLKKVYTETALPAVNDFWSGALSAVINASPATALIAHALSGKGWSDTENLVFVKTSPVDFPTDDYNLSRLSIGSLGISNVQAKVVKQYLISDKVDLGAIGSGPQSFTDVEPYASASIFFPLAGSVAVPPSVLADSSATVQYSFNLLNEGAGYSIHINKGGNYLHLAKNGQCAKSADCVIPGRDISGTVSSLGALAATGIATLATGGTAAPALVTTALGAATTAVHEATDLSITNMPPTSSGSPYDDTVNGGLRDIVLYRTKAERFTSGEGSTNQRADVMGTFSYKYIDSLSDIGDGNFISVLDVKLEESSGMTKAEHDKIVALLKEGVYM